MSMESEDLIVGYGYGATKRLSFLINQLIRKDLIRKEF